MTPRSLKASSTIKAGTSNIEGKPLRPGRDQIEYLIQRVEAEAERNRGVLPESAIAEYREALEAYREIANGLE